MKITIYFLFLLITISSCDNREKITCELLSNGLYNCSDNGIDYVVDSLLLIKGIKWQGVNIALRKNNRIISSVTEIDSLNRPKLIIKFNQNNKIKELRTIDYSFDEQIVVLFSKEHILTQVFYNAPFVSEKKEWLPIYYLNVDVKNRKMSKYYYYYYKDGYHIMDSEIGDAESLSMKDSIVLRYTTQLNDLSKNGVPMNETKLLKNSLTINVDSTLVLGSLKLFSNGHLMKKRFVVMKGNVYKRMLDLYSKKELFPQGLILSNKLLVNDLSQSQILIFDELGKKPLILNSEKFIFNRPDGKVLAPL